MALASLSMAGEEDSAILLRCTAASLRQSVFLSSTDACLIQQFAQNEEIQRTLHAKLLQCFDA